MNQNFNYKSEYLEFIQWIKYRKKDSDWQWLDIQLSALKTVGKKENKKNILQRKITYSKVDVRQRSNHAMVITFKYWHWINRHTFAASAEGD